MLKRTLKAPPPFKTVLPILVPSENTARFRRTKHRRNGRVCSWMIASIRSRGCHANTSSARAIHFSLSCRSRRPPNLNVTQLRIPARTRTGGVRRSLRRHARHQCHAPKTRQERPRKSALLPSPPSEEQLRGGFVDAAAKGVRNGCFAPKSRFSYVREFGEPRSLPSFFSSSSSNLGTHTHRGVQLALSGIMPLLGARPRRY